jgi:DNA polymerase elongation subunit (family B)
MKETNTIYLDCEWFIGGQLFLIGGCYSNGKTFQLYSNSLKQSRFQLLIRNVKYIFFYGPDIGILEKNFNINIRDNYYCFNLLKIFRQVLPPQKNYKLSALETKFGIYRERCEYKKNMFDIFSDWKNTEKRKRVLQYNREDVINLMKLKRIIFKKYKVKLSDQDRLK